MAVFKNGHALIVGVGDDLPVTITDAKGIAKNLKDEERCAYPPSQVNLLTGERSDRDSIIAGLDKLIADCTEESTAVIYFSGHGYEVDSGFGKFYFLMPHGYKVNNLKKTALSGQDFVDKIRDIPAKKKLILLDCCHAGGFSDAAKAPGVPPMTKSPIPPETTAILGEGNGVILIASSKANELSRAGSPYSAFTLALLEALNGVGNAENDGFVRATDLALHAREVVPGRTDDTQHPILKFKAADDFEVAYYAGGDVKPKGLPFDVSAIKIDSEPRGSSTIINSGGGAVIQGNVNTDGGDFVGRDQINKVGNVGAGAAVAQGRGARAQVNNQGSQKFAMIDGLLQSLLSDLEGLPTERKAEGEKVANFANGFVAEVKSDSPNSFTLEVMKNGLLEAAAVLANERPGVPIKAEMVTEAI